MITIFHGNDTATSRKFFVEEKQKVKDPFSFDSTTTTLANLMQTFEGGSLFSEHKKIFIEDFFSQKKSKELAEIAQLIQRNTKTAEIHFWEKKELSKSQLSQFKDATIKFFNFPQSMFTFLDNIKPNNGKNLLNLFYKTLENSEIELVFFMLIRQFRLLLAVFEQSNEQIDEIKRLAPWQKSKLQKQASMFSLEQLKNSYKKLFEIDLAQKTGTLNLSLQQAIDMFLINL